MERQAITFGGGRGTWFAIGDCLNALKGVPAHITCAPNTLEKERERNEADIEIEKVDIGCGLLYYRIADWDTNMVSRHTSNISLEHIIEVHIF